MSGASSRNDRTTPPADADMTEGDVQREGKPRISSSEVDGLADAPDGAAVATVKVEGSPPGCSEADLGDGEHVNGSLHPDGRRRLSSRRVHSPEPTSDPSLSEATSKKRRRTDTPKSRAVSPPWKLPAIEGPTTFTQEGKRRSARTNELPIDLKPGADQRRHTRAEHHKAQEKQDARRPNSINTGKSSPVASRSKVAAASAAFKAPASKAPQQTHLQTRRTRRSSDSVTDPMGAISVRRNSQTAYGKRTRSGEAASSPESSHKRVRPDNTAHNLSTPAKSNVSSSLVAGAASSPASSGFKLRLRGLIEANREPPRTLNPLHGIDLDKIKHNTFASFIEQDDVWDGEDERPMSEKQAARTARSISRLIKEGQPGGLLSEERSMILSQPQQAEEPPDVYGHWQHVVAQALNFRQLLYREVKQHQEAARRAANAATSALSDDRRFTKLKPRISREEWEAQQYGYQKKRYQQIVRDVQGSWGMVRKEVLKALEKEQEVKRQKEGREALDSMLDHSTALLNQRRGRNSMSLASDDDDEEYGSSATPYSRELSTSRGPSRMSVVSTPVAGSAVEGDVLDEGSASDSENMSSSGEEDDEAEDDPDANLTAEELRAKYGDLPETDLMSDQEQADSDEGGDVSMVASELHSEAEEDARSHREGSIDPATVALEEVDGALEEDDDQSSGSETESASDTEGSVSSEDDQSVSGEESDGDAMNGMLGFFGKSTIVRMKQEQGPDLDISETDDHSHQADPHAMDVDQDLLRPTATAEVVGKAGIQGSPAAEGESVIIEDKTLPVASRNDSTVEATIPVENMADAIGEVGGVPTPAATSIADADTPNHEMTRAEASTPVDPANDEMQDAKELMIDTDATSRSGTPKGQSLRPTSPMSASRPLTPRSGQSGQIDVSLLLRGNLREYQQNGLDWLAGLYSHGSNGILADEMGLGKTIQTISLFAHLAIHQKEWGPHLVVVPTSVMLNWEMEFKKFLPGFKVLTYYGSVAERKKLRSGWLTNDKWNVVITSYQLVVQDKQAFKKRPWHYLVLDEAHQIKNWQTQKWQSMLNMNTQARLLLTGTPLQNNLSELWSLFFFLMPGEGVGGQGFAELEQFQQAMKRPADQILNQGKQVLDEQARTQVKKLHEVLRPYLLRRLKADVEKQMPGKYEHVVYCKLSKRQRQLYDAFLGRADTKATLLGGSYVGVMHVLMELRKVCNHPDLFEERMVRTSFSMPRSAVATYEPVDLLVRKRLLADSEATVSLEHLGLNFVHKERTAKQIAWRAEYLQANRPMADLIERETKRLAGQEELGQTTLWSAQAILNRHAQWENLQRLKASRSINITRTSTAQRPLYGVSLRNHLTIDKSLRPFPKPVLTRTFDKKEHHQFFSQVPLFMPEPPVAEMGMTLAKRASAMHDPVRKFSIATPNVVAHDIRELTLGKKVLLAAEEARAAYLQEYAIASPTPVVASKIPQALRPLGGVEAKPDAFHEARIRQTIAFPDKRLLQYDCGKLQKLATLLRDLQAGGHRALIFTQMSRVLDILEIFLNFHGYRYLRLDGTTKVEHRQLLTEKYNSDPRILVFILSSRSGGLGINLTGADSVIFYDLDWNPAMDKQCQDRAHRIGQTRDVHIYKFVSEYTIEANILRKSNQKRLLDDVIIQKGEFTTDYFNRVTHKDALEGMLGEDSEASKAMDMVLGDDKQVQTVLQSVEDKDDATAAAAAAKEAHDVEAEDEKEMGDAEELDEADAKDLNKLDKRDKDADWRHVDDYMFDVVYRELLPQAEMLFRVKARDKAAARRAKDRNRVR